MHCCLACLPEGDEVEVEEEEEEEEEEEDRRKLPVWKKTWPATKKGAFRH
jgi:hypothetical protein